MAEYINDYSYDNGALSGPGITEQLVREGMLPNDDGLHTPRSEVKTEAQKSKEDFIFNIRSTMKPETVIKEAYKREVCNDVAVEYKVELTWKGLVILTFIDTADSDVKAFIKYHAQLNPWGIHCKKDVYDEGKKVVITITQDATLTSDDYVFFGLIELGKTFNLEDMRQAYLDKVYHDLSLKDATPEFKALVEVISKETVTKFLFESLADIKDKEYRKDLLSLFSGLKENLAKYYFGGNYTGQDIGFYFDNSDRMRIVYDKFMLSYSIPLLKDVKELKRMKELVLGYFSETGTFVYVLSKELSQALKDKYQDEMKLAAAYNNQNLDYKLSEVKPYLDFRYIVDISKQEITDVNTIFGLQVH